MPPVVAERGSLGITTPDDLLHPNLLSGAGLFMNTNHESESLDELKSLASSELFAGSRVRIVDESQRVFFEPPVRESTGDLSLSSLAAMLGVPIIEPPEDFLRGNGEDDDDA